MSLDHTVKISNLERQSCLMTAVVAEIQLVVLNRAVAIGRRDTEGTHALVCPLAPFITAILGRDLRDADLECNLPDTFRRPKRMLRKFN
jgi:hypothetical protein